MSPQDPHNDDRVEELLGQLEDIFGKLSKEQKQQAAPSPAAQAPETPSMMPSMTPPAPAPTPATPVVPEIPTMAPPPQPAPVAPSIPKEAAQTPFQDAPIVPTSPVPPPAQPTPVIPSAPIMSAPPPIQDAPIVPATPVPSPAQPAPITFQDAPITAPVQPPPSTPQSTPATFQEAPMAPPLTPAPAPTPFTEPITPTAPPVTPPVQEAPAKPVIQEASMPAAPSIPTATPQAETPTGSLPTLDTSDIDDPTSLNVAIFFPDGREKEGKVFLERIQSMTPKFTKVAFRIKVRILAPYDPKTFWEQNALPQIDQQKIRAFFLIADRAYDEGRKRALTNTLSGKNIYFQDVPLLSVEKKAFYTDLLLGIIFFFDSLSENKSQG